jgi:hypothetical protein
MSYREVIGVGAIFCVIVSLFVVLAKAAEPSINESVELIRLALTPVFLLTAVGALLNVFSTRLGRVADRVDQLSAKLQRGAADTELSKQLDSLRRRSRFLDVAVVLATIGGAATCAAVLVLFLGAALGNVHEGTGNVQLFLGALGNVHEGKGMALLARALLFGFFGGAIAFTIAALVAFLIEMILAGHGLRNVIDQHQKTTGSHKSGVP